ncbi:MAG: hypothetical protein QOH97_2043 [Actinoplanes sp.]|jgi:hypothetical protein|nr:hypothetical protein [Actinoplanes sp.]
MLRPAWYLADTNWLAQNPGVPVVGTEQALFGELTALFHDPLLNPAMTVKATYLTLLAAEHLGTAMTHGARIHDVNDLARLLCGLNLVTAHLTQTVQHVAENIEARTFHGLSRTSDGLVRSLADSASRAAANGEIFAGHLKEAHLTLRTSIK